MAKIIFLDIGGVLVNRQSLMKASGLRSTAWPSCVEALNSVTKETGAQIVISSTWRYFHKQMGYESPLTFMRAKLAEWGVTGKVIGCTPDLARKTNGSALYVAVERGDEIQAWLDSESYERRPVESFCIVDDDADMKHLLSRLVRTDFAEGFTQAHAARAIEMLSHPAG
jgi:hypothetical protein